MGGSNLMSAIAGRVLLIPRGNYDATATYTMLDMVVYNGSSYICKQECTGVVPTNTTYWMLNASGSAVAYLNDIGDVVITNVSNGQVLMYDSTTQKWVNGTITTTLAGLTDTDILNPANGDGIVYDNQTGKWKNSNNIATKTEVNAIHTAHDTVLSATLTTGQTTLTFTNNAIVSTSMCELLSVGGVIIAPTQITDDSANHSVTFTFDAQETDISFKLRVINIV